MFSRVSVFPRGACMAGGVWPGGACVVGDMHGWWGVCMPGGDAWQERRQLQQVVRILLECILVLFNVTTFHTFWGAQIFNKNKKWDFLKMSRHTRFHWNMSKCWFRYDTNFPFSNHRFAVFVANIIRQVISWEIFFTLASGEIQRHDRPVHFLLKNWSRWNCNVMII